MILVPVKITDAIKALEADNTYRLTVWYGKNQSMSIDKGQMYRPVSEVLFDILANNPFYGLYMAE